MTRLAATLLAVGLLAGCTNEGGGVATSTTGAVTTSSAAQITSPSTGPPTTLPQPLPDGSLAVLVVGDSVMFDAEAGIQAALDATGAATVQNGAVFGLGFSDGAGIPFAGAADDLLATPVDQVVLMVGSWDHLAAQRDADAYADAVDAGLARLSQDGRSLLVLGEPPSDPAKGEEPVRSELNEVLAEATLRAGGVFLPTDSVIGTPDGQYLLRGPDGLLRKPDGRHLCPAGAARFAEAVVTQLQTTWELPDPNPVWALGPWRDDPRYDNPDGGCPAG